LNKSSLIEQLSHLNELRRCIPDSFEQTLKNDLIVCLSIKIPEEEPSLLTQVYLFNGQSILNSDRSNEADLALLDQSVIRFSRSLASAGLAVSPPAAYPPPLQIPVHAPVPVPVPVPVLVQVASTPLLPPQGGSTSAIPAAPVPTSTTLVPDNSFVLYSVDGKVGLVLSEFDSTLTVSGYLFANYLMSLF
jgi:hypothetical protein